MPKTWSCAVELAVDVVGGRWRTVILSHLKEGVHRYGELRRVIPGSARRCSPSGCASWRRTA